MPITYQHMRAGLMEAMPRAEFAARVPGSTAPVQADWIAVTAGSTHPLGYITDNRADAGGEPSEIMPGNEAAQPYEAYDSRGRYITVTHSLRGALLAIGNRT